MNEQAFIFGRLDSLERKLAAVELAINYLANGARVPNNYIPELERTITELREENAKLKENGEANPNLSYRKALAWLYKNVPFFHLKGNESVFAPDWVYEAGIEAYKGEGK